MSNYNNQGRDQANKTFKWLLVIGVLYAGGFALERYFESERYILTLGIKGLDTMVSSHCYTLKASIERQIAFKHHDTVNIFSNKQMNVFHKWVVCGHW